jgi:alanyl aminopeptidase
MRLGTILLLLLATFAAASCDSGDTGKSTTEQKPKSIAAPGKARAAPERDVPQGQLPRNVDPVHYRLHLTLNPDQLRYDGEVEIEIDLKAPKREIYLHGRDLVVGRVTARILGRPEIKGTYTQVDASGVARLTFEQQLPVGRAKVTLPFSAPFETQPDALTAMTESGTRYVWTQFQEISARRAFPCFDEPRFKTPFDISITHIARHVAIANTPPVSAEAIAEGVTRTTFSTTAPLPTYLVAIIVGPYDIATGPSVPPTALRPAPLPVRAVSVRGKISAAQFALKETPPLVRAMENYFAAPFPYAKLDLIAPPNFLAGGMENAGAITYTERGLLLGDKPSIAQRRYFRLLHAHEVAHQWFGDLVTPRWWNDIWLNEAFASWLGNRIAAELWPQDEIERETARKALEVMDLDALSSARAIRQPIITNDDIFNAFDGLTYDKGAAILQMFEQYLGRDVFREGVRLHMRRFAHATADTDDFFASLAAASKKPDVIRAMETFLNQPGLPLVSVETTCSGRDLNVTISQSPYGATSVSDKRVWSVPVCMRELGKGRPLPCTMLGAEPRSFTVKKLCNVPLAPNASASGYYRFTMPQKDWVRLTASLSTMNAAEQLATLQSLRAAFRAGDADAATYLSALRSAITSGEWDVIELATGYLREIHANLVEPAARSSFETGMRSWFERPFAGVTRPDNNARPAVALGRAAHATLAVSVAMHPEASASLATTGRALLSRIAEGRNDITLDEMAPPALWAAIAAGSEDAAAMAIRALRTTRQAEHRNVLVRSLAAAGDAAAIGLIREFVLSRELNVREVFAYLRETFAHANSRDGAWDWIRRDYAGLVKVTGEGTRSRFMSLPATLCAKQDGDAIRTFFEPMAEKVAGAPRTLANTLDAVNRCHAWKQSASASMTAAIMAATR